MRWTQSFVSRDSSRNFIKKFIGKKLKFIYIINEVEQLGKSYMCIGQSLSEDWEKWANEIDNGKSQTICDNIVGIVCDLHMFAEDIFNNVLIKPMLTTNLSATYDDFVPYTGDGETLTHDVAEIKNDLGGLTFSASGTTLSITDGTNTWTLKANS